MKYGIIDATAKELKVIEADDIKDAEKQAGLNPGELDFGSFYRGLGYCVYEFGLMQPPDKTKYCSYKKTLIAGNAVLYGVDERGETIDFELSMLHSPIVFMNGDEVEEAISKGQVHRPIMAVNEEVLWSWPNAEGVKNA